MLMLRKNKIKREFQRLRLVIYIDEYNIHFQQQHSSYNYTST